MNEAARKRPAQRLQEGGQRKGKSRKAKKKERQAAEELEEERRLTSLLFGDDEEQLARRNVEEVNGEMIEESSLSLFEIDRVGGPVHNEDELVRDGDERNHSNVLLTAESTNESKPVWDDEDEKDLTVNLLDSSRLRKLRRSRNEAAATCLPGSELETRLRERYQSTAQIGARTEWAQFSEKEDGEETEDGQNEEVAEFQDSSEPLLLGVSAHARLQPNILSTVRCPDANQSDPNQAVVQAVNFHRGSDPDNPLLLTAGFDKTLRFFQVGPEKSEKIHGIHFPKLPIYSASFLGNTGNVVVSGRRPFFYIYDAICGKLDHVPRILGREEKSLERCVPSPDGRTLAFCGNDGYIILFDAHNKHWIADLKMNGSVRAITFTPDGEHLIASGSDGDVYRWELKSRRCIERFANEDGTITSALAASSRHLAVGAESGVVNLFSEQTRNASATASAQGPMFRGRKPIKSIMNLHTSADMVRFNHDGQILALSSRREKMGMKLLHVPTASVFSNWPTSKTPLNYVWCMDFSPQSRYLAIGNDQGKCLLYRLTHYQD